MYANSFNTVNFMINSYFAQLGQKTSLYMRVKTLEYPQQGKHPLLQTTPIHPSMHSFNHSIPSIHPTICSFASSTPFPHSTPLLLKFECKVHFGELQKKICRQALHFYVNINRNMFGIFKAEPNEITFETFHFHYHSHARSRSNYHQQSVSWADKQLSNQTYRHLKVNIQQAVQHHQGEPFNGISMSEYLIGKYYLST